MWASMTPANIHTPPTAAVVAELIRAGVSPETAMAMERWKADEVLELLRFKPEPGHAALRARKGTPAAC
jgi:hypothetical protein